MSKPRTPQEKKELSLERDRRNTYGENAKSSRKNIPLSKQASHQAERRAGNAPLMAIRGTVPEDLALDAELHSREQVIEKHREAFVKHPDTPLGTVLKHKAARKTVSGSNRVDSV